MKKIILSSMLFAAAAMAFVSCQKSETTPTPESKLVTLKFTSANPTTKTEYNGETIVWSPGDQIRMACTANGIWQDENGNVAEGGNARLYLAGVMDGTLTEPSETATFTLAAKYKVATSAPYQFYTVYPNTARPGTAFVAPNAEVSIIGEQTSTTNTFDKGADLLWGKSVKAYELLPLNRTEETIPLSWTRLVAHANITLNAIKGITEGEKVNTVKLTAQDGAALTGSYNLNMTTGEFTPGAPSNIVEIICKDIYVDASGSFSFWACINPCTITSLDIEVETDKAKYLISKTGFTREFLKNRRNELSINMSNATKGELEAPITVEGFTRIESIDEVVTGEYIIACDVNGAYFAASTTIASNALQSIALTLNDKTLSFADDAPDHIFTITREDNQVNIYANGKYVSKKSSGTGLEYVNQPYMWNLINNSTSRLILQPNTQTNRYLMYYYVEGATHGFKAATNSYKDSEYKHIILFRKN